MRRQRGIERLSQRDMDNIEAKGMYPDGKGLYVQAGDGGQPRSWIFRYSIVIGGKRFERHMGLGSLDTVTSRRRVRRPGNAA